MSPSGVVHMDPVDKCGTDPGCPRWTQAALHIPGHRRPGPCPPLHPPPRGAATQPVPRPRQVTQGLGGKRERLRPLSPAPGGASHHMPCNCTVVPVSKWWRGGTVMSLISQDGSFPVQGSRPDWEELCFIQVVYYSEY